MGKKGRLTADKFGYSMPVDAPAYPMPPALMRNVESFTITYETDLDAALELLPEADGLELADEGTAKMVFVKMPYTPWGAYNEIYQLLDCVWEGTPCIFPVRLLVDNDIPLIIGRELWGNPKKFGNIEFRQESSIIQCTGERPRGTRLCTGLIQLEKPLEVAPSMMHVVGLRVIPNPECPERPSLAELLLNANHVRPKEAWLGSCSLSFDARSELDPWYKLPVKKLVQAVYMIGDMETIPKAKILKRY